MGTLHYAIVQRGFPPNEHRSTEQWDTVAIFEFGKDYELWRWLHSLKPKAWKYLPRDIAESLSEDEKDNYYWQLFEEKDFEGKQFKYGMEVIQRKIDLGMVVDNSDTGEKSELFEGLLVMFKVLSEPKRILICQDQ